MVGEPFGTAMSENSFSVESRAGAHPRQRVLRLTGRVDVNTVPHFVQAVRSEQAPAVILDLIGVSCVDSGGVGALVQTYSSFRKADRRLALVVPSPRTGRPCSSLLACTSCLPSFPPWPRRISS